MGDRLTQLQDAVDQFAQQMVACVHYLHRHHGVEVMGPTDEIVTNSKLDEEQAEALFIDPHPPDEFKEAQVELARDLITKEQQIEYLISILPGLDNSERDQESNIAELEDELRVAEAQRQEAVKEKEDIMKKLDSVVRTIRRP